LEKIEYSDLNKFLVSIGVALMAISILILWLFFKEPFDLLIDKDRLDHLTNLAKAIITTRQGQVAKLLCFIPWLSLFLFLLGLLSLICGLLRWWKKQHLLDERDELTNKKLKKELEKLSEKEVEEKAETEYTETIEMQPEKREDQKEITNKENFIRSYLNVEQEISDKLRLLLSDQYRILTNYRLKQVEYDIILNAPLKQDADIIIQIKYYPNGANSPYLKGTLIKMEMAKKLYQETMKKKAKSVLIIVVPESKFNLFEIAKLKAVTKQIKHRDLKPANFSMHFMQENKLSELTKESINNIIDGD
jgi:hypothetical protein